MRLEELRDLPGIGRAKACQVKAALELGRRNGHSDGHNGGVLSGPSERRRNIEFRAGMAGGTVIWTGCSLCSPNAITTASPFGGSAAVPR